MGQATDVKVLHVINALGNGGAEGVLGRLITGDRRNRHEVISLMDTGFHGDRLASGGIPVHALGMARGRLKFAAVAELYRLVRAIRPDVVQTWMYHSDLVGGVVARMAGAKRIVWGIRASSLDPTKVPRSTRFVVKMNVIMARWVPDRIIVCSQEAARFHAALGYPQQKMTVVPNGYDLSAMKPDESSRLRMRNQMSIGSSEVVLGMVARWDPQKDHSNLLSALALLQQRDLAPWCAWFIGPGLTADNAELRNLLQRSGVADRVQLLGQRTDIPAILNALDLHVLSSSYGEAFPNVVAEAMACGVPCVATDVGDAGLILDGTGWLVPPRDSAKLAEAIECALRELTDAEVWARRKQSARRRIAEHFGLEAMIRAYNDLWSESSRDSRHD
jgi:glycosyltransferase involved in cell wall biosynthesis